MPVKTEGKSNYLSKVRRLALMGSGQVKWDKDSFPVSLEVNTRQRQYFQPMKFILGLLTCTSILLACSKEKFQSFPASYEGLQWEGRREDDPQGHKWLWSSGAWLKFKFQGDSCRIVLRSHAPANAYNYISFVIDGVHTHRIKIDFDSLEALTLVPEQASQFHEVELFKETEAKNGAIEIGSIEAKALLRLPASSKKKIEFIGNSITAGMSADASAIPCDQGKWFDQHNAYDSYGAVVSRQLNCDFLLAAYSGLGMYRNWNTDFPVMKDIYESVSLNPDSTTTRWNYDLFKPDIIALCIGANDLSDGDGHTPRLPFDSSKFIHYYVSFLKQLHAHQPQAQFLLLNGPVNSPHKDSLFIACLLAIKSKSEAEMADLKPIRLQYFKLITPLGCNGHPDLDQHAAMAEEIRPVLIEMLKE